jgi:anaerobic selenocysteine-containing dehydrogenase
VLPATSQLEHADIHKAYGQLTLQYNAPAIPPLGESKSNWDVMRLLAAALGYTEAWLHHDTDTLLAEVLDATRTRARPPIRAALEGMTLERLKEAGSLPLNLPEGFVPFADGRFPTPSGKVELRCDVLAGEGLDPLPSYVPPAEFAGAASDMLALLSGAPHHFVSSSLANQESLRQKEGPPCIELNPADAAARGIRHGAQVRVTNARGECLLRAIITSDVPPGVAVAPKGHWGQFSPDGRNINWTTSDALGDLAGQSTFHSNLVRVAPADTPERQIHDEGHTA